jgi:EamA domain-containing membrane protein RarD
MNLYNKNNMNPDDVLLYKVVLGIIVVVIILVVTRQWYNDHMMAEFYKAHPFNPK